MSLDKFDTENQRELVFPVLLVGEGKADVSFFMKLMTERGIGNLHFGFPTEATGGFGLTALGKFLSSLPTRTGFSALKAIMVFYDNDSNPATAFQRVKATISASDPYSVPDAPLTLGQASGGKVRLMFVPMPAVATVGALETLLLQSAEAEAAALACVDAFATCSTIASWEPSHQAKMRLRSLIAAKCKGKSDMTLTNIWSAAGNPINLTHACFDGLAQTVRDVVAAV